MKKFETLVTWLTDAALLEEPDSTTALVINKIFEVLEGDVSANPKGSINVIRDHLRSFIDRRVVFPGLKKPIDIFEELDPARKSGGELIAELKNGLTEGQVHILKIARDRINDEKQRKQKEKEQKRKEEEQEREEENARATATATAELVAKVKKEIPADDMERHIQNIRDALERENLDEAIYHLFALNVLLKKIRPLLGKDQAKADATDFMDIIKKAYPELTDIACNDMVKKQGTLLQEILQMAHQDLDKKMLSPADNDAMSNKLNIAKTVLKIFASAVTKEGSDELFNPDEWKDEEWEKAENKAKEFDVDTSIIRHLTRSTPIEGVLPKANQLFNANKPMINQFQTKLHDHQIKHAREIYDAQMKLATQAEQGKSRQAKSNASQRGSKVAFEFLRHIQKTIYTTDWKPARFFGTKVYDTKGKYINTVRKDMIKMLDIIEEAYRKDQTGTSPVWIEAFNKVAKLGKLAASKQPLSLFGIGQRSWEEQQFYEKFVTAYSNRDLYLAGLKSQGEEQTSKSAHRRSKKT